MQAISDNENLIIIATGKYVGEGFDYPRLDTLFLALPIAWKGKVAQYAGRLHRNYPGKSDVQIYDYVDMDESYDVLKKKITEWFSAQQNGKKEQNTIGSK